MPDIQISTTTVTTIRKEVTIPIEDVQEILRQHFDMPVGTRFDWNVRYGEDVDEVTAVHETVERSDD